ncbi:hypothetical protein [Aquabacterium sp.]|uniref:hypothetical protein n=1 Tax=Aquabacterium sp. TaxID=1872578 RepID=UPI002C4A69A8|nr:hypothetical protein [Aquabacterium sp.]HSW07427.1 hypothetical protein [Aquabacterium sp.]
MSAMDSTCALAGAEGDAAFEPLRRELAQWQAAGRCCPLWWRDDDLVADTPALRRLADFAARNALPALVAVIPGQAADALAADTAAFTGLSFCQHGWQHRNHEADGAAPSEFGAARQLDAVAEDLRRGRERMAGLFGDRFVPVFVPPWNRFRSDALTLLPELGLRGISQYRGQTRGTDVAVRAVDCHLDILQWAPQPPIRCQPVDALVEVLVAVLREHREAAEPPPLGILSHHRPMGDDAWAFMQRLVDVSREFDCVRWLPAAELFALDRG